MKHQAALLVAWAILASALPVIAEPPDSRVDGPEFDVLHLTAGVSQPAAVVRTAATEEEDWMDIGRQLRERAPDVEHFVVHFYASGSPDLPADYATNDEARRRAERWLIGHYTYYGPRARFRGFNSDLPVEVVGQRRIEPRVVEIEGLRFTELHTTGGSDSPAYARINLATVAAANLERATLDGIVEHYEGHFATPRVLVVQVFDGEPDWPHKPFLTPDMNAHPHVVCRRSSDLRRGDDGFEIVPREREWLVTGADGELVPLEAVGSGAE